MIYLKIDAKKILDSRKSEIQKSYEILQENCNAINSINFMNVVRNSSLKEIMENTEYIISDNRATDFLSYVLKTNDLSIEDIQLQMENINKFTQGKEIPSERLEKIQECVNYLTSQKEKKESLEFLREDTKYKLVTSKLPQPILESSVTEEMDIIIQNINYQPEVAERYEELLHEIRQWKGNTTLLNFVPLIIKNTALVLGLTIFVAGSIISLIISLPLLLVSKLIENRVEKRYISSYIVIINKEIKTLEEAIKNADPKKRTIIENYIQALKQTRERLLKYDIYLKNFKGIREGIAEMQPVITYEEFEKEMELQLDDICNTDFKEEIPVLELFFKKKDKNQKLTIQEFNKEYLSKLKVINQKCRSEITKILLKPEHSLAKKGFKFPSKLRDDESSTSINIIDWDIWKIYRDARSRYPEDVREYDRLYSEIFKITKEISSSIIPNSNVYDDGDCDGGTIRVSISKVSIIDSDVSESFIFSQDDDICLIEALDYEKLIIENAFYNKFVNLFMDETEEISLESFNEFINILENYEYLMNSSDIILESDGRNSISRKVALKGEKISKGVVKNIRKAQYAGKHTAVVAKRIPGHIENLINNTIDKIKKMDKDERRNRIVEGSFRLKLMKIIRNGIMVGTGWYVNPALTAIGLIAGYAVDKKADKKVRSQILHELQTELNIVNEKIDDARSDSNRQSKYQLMRIKNKLETDIERIRYKLD